MTTRPHPVKRLGQNFLTSLAYQQEMVDALRLCREDVVLEIGPGRGALTKLLLNKGVTLYAAEKDPRMVQFLNETMGPNPHLILIESDILELDFSRQLKLSQDQKLKVIGSLPYYLTSPILFFLFDNRARIEEAVIMVQKEVGERLVAKPGTKDYGALTVAARVFADVRIVRHVPPGAFWPRPKVTSSIVHLLFRRSTSVDDSRADGFLKFNKQMFSGRRKTVGHRLKSLFADQLPNAVISDILVRCRLDPKTRYETLDIPDMAALYRQIETKLTRKDR